MSLDNVLLQHGCTEVGAMTCYTDVFRLGTGAIQKENEPEDRDSFKTKPIVYMKNWNEEHGHYRLLFEDTFEETLKESYEYDFAIINGLTYFGRKMQTDKASKMFALCIDLDGTTDKTLDHFLAWCELEDQRFTPMPNYIKLSGHNVHLVYVFKEPISLYPNIKFQLKQFKYGLIRCVWTPYTSTIEQVQYQSINQGFRPIGGKTKIEDVRVRCFSTGHKHWTIEELNEYIVEEFRIDIEAKNKATQLSFDDALKEYPEWAEAVLNGTNKKQWNISRNLYEWSKRRVIEDAIYHHRYFGMMLIAICGVKCSFKDDKKNPNPVTKEEVEKDLKELQPYLTQINPNDPITDSDINSALDAFDYAYITFPRADLEKLTAIPMPQQKRLYQKQKDHLEEARAIRDIRQRRKGSTWNNSKGAPTKEVLIKEFANKHPEYSNRKIAEELGISRNTVNKWRKR